VDSTWFGRRAGRVLASAGLVAGILGVAAPTAASAAAPPVQAFEQLVANLHVGSPNQPAHVYFHEISGLNNVASNNWSGYADDNSTGRTYQKVSGTWKEPAITCVHNNDVEVAVFWVGIDGYNNSTVEQDGTLAECKNGAVVGYGTWWEMFPTNAIQLVGGSVLPGDSINGSVAYSSTTHKYTLKVTDSTHPANSFSTVQACGTTPCHNGSAEWIAERPSSGSTLLELPNYHTWTVKAAKTTSQGKAGVISTFPDDNIKMVNSSSQTLSSAGALNATGNSFKATWHRGS
jgi:hypothetical protein